MDPALQAVIVSDLHFGSRYFHAAPFRRFLDALPPAADLILNGDIIDRRSLPLSGAHLEAEKALGRESGRRRVIWVRGNHDEQYTPEAPADIQFTDTHAIGKRLLVMHGNHLDNVMRRYRPFLLVFRFGHFVRIRLGAEPVHVAFYAKRFPMLYRVLRRHVATNAAAIARAKGFAAVTCGHTHFAEELEFDGVRYINTGAWTERPLHYLAVTAQALMLEVFEPG